MKRRAEARTVEDLPEHLTWEARPKDQASYAQWNRDRRSWCEANGVSVMLLLIHEREHKWERNGDGAA